VCPTTLAEIKRVFERLGKDAGRVRFLMVSVDPERDTPDVLASDGEHFDPQHFVGLTGPLEEIEVVTVQYGVVFEYDDVGSQAGYLVNHTATITLIDPDGYVRVIYPFGVKAQGIAADVRYILKR